jgi:small-conductance mechanosensitive channel
VLAFCCLVVACTSGGTTPSTGTSSATLPNAVEKLAKIRATNAAPAASAERPEDAIKSSSELVIRAQAALRDLQRIASEATIPPELETLAQQLPARRDELKARIAEARDAVHRSRRLAWVRDIRYSFVDDDQWIAAWQAEVKEASTAVTSGRARTEDLVTFWRRADELARQANAPQEVRDQTAGVVNEAVRTELRLARPEAVTIPLELTLSDMRDMLDGFFHYLDREGPNLALDARERDFTLLAALQGLAHLHDPVATIRGTSDHMLEMTRLFLANSGDELLGHSTLLLVLLLAMLSLRSKAAGWVGEERQGRIARRVVKRPFATTVLLGMVGGIAIYQTIPTLALVVAYALAMVAAVVLFPSLLDPRFLRAGYALCGFMLIDLARLYVIELLPLERVMLTLELVAACVVLGSMLTAERWKASLFAGWTPFYRGVAWCWFAGAGAGVVASVFGYGSIAEIVGGGVLVSMYLALIYAAAFGAAEGTAWVLTQDGLFGRLKSVQRYRADLVHSISYLLRWAALLLWANSSLEYLTLGAATRRLLYRILSASLEVGSLKISLGDIVILVLGAVLAFFFARLIRFVLEEDVVTHFSVTASTRQVTSITAYYVVLLLGFFFTLAAAGIQLDRLTVLAGALGVGIGFGLQNVVQNFVAGLLLLFGGPIKIGDKIQIGDVQGEVQAIGFRASTVRTWQGAEVIVPNSKLVTDQVVNWTLSDQKRRVDIDVGVDYGTDPVRVLGLLQEIARAHPKVLTTPAPSAVFVSHTDNSLAFQLFAWTTFDDSGNVKSELTTAINQRFTSEKIGFPYPQRDLRLKEVAPEVLEALRTPATKSS